MNLINVLQYCKEFYDDEYMIFNDILVPDGIDKIIMINTILDKSALNDVVYDNINFLKFKVENFFLKNNQIYNRLYKAFISEYNTLENYDRKEDITTTYNRDRDLSNSHKESSNKNTSDTVNSTDENKTSAFNSSTYQSDNLATNTSTSSNTESNTSNGSYSDNENIDDITKVVGRIHGNIGVTTAQQMLESELEIRPKLNIYEVIANDFYNEFMIKVCYIGG